MRTAYAFEDMQDPGTDIAFRVGTFKDDRLVARRLGAFRVHLVASPAFLETHRIKAPADLAAVSCIVFRGDTTRATWILRKGEEETAVEVSGALGAQNFTILRDLAQQGAGVAYLPDFLVADAIEDGRLVRCLPDYGSRPFPVYLAYRPGARRIARLDATIALAEAHIPSVLSE